MGIFQNSVVLPEEHKLDETQKEIFNRLNISQNGSELELLFMGKWLYRAINPLQKDLLLLVEENGEIKW